MARREARAKERDNRAWELKEAREATADAFDVVAANERAAQIQSKLNEKLSLLQSQMQYLATKLDVPLDTIPLIAASPCITTRKPPLPSASASVAQVVEH